MKIRTHVLVALIAASAITMVQAESEQRGQRQRPTQPQTTAPAQGARTYSRAEAEQIAKRLYKAALGHDGDAAAITDATVNIQGGRLPVVIQTVLASAEFRNNQANKAPGVLLEQFYRGLVDRVPDNEGIRLYLTKMQQQLHAVVLEEMINTDDFRSVIGAAPNTTGSPATPAPSAGVVRIDTALACQGKVLEAIRREANGHVLITFDRMPDISGDGNNVSGAAMDRTTDKADRDLSYRCAGNDATFSYRDNQRPVAPDARLKYNSVAVQNCEAAVQSGGRFDAAALSASDNSTEYVLGIVGGAVRQCTMDRQRVVSVK